MDYYKTIKMNSRFTSLVEQRLQISRKNSDRQLEPISSEIVTLLAESNEDVSMRAYLDEKIDAILADCQVYFEMEKEKAYDQISELSNYAAIYADKRESIYDKICTLMRITCRSYPN